MSTTPSTSVLERRAEIEQPPQRELFETFQRMVRDEGHRFVVSLGGGSLPALCGNVALLKLLEELELTEQIDAVWGTSAGAIVGGAWASGTSADEVWAAIQSLDAPGSLDVAWLRVALGFLGRPFGARLPDALVKGRAFHRTIARALSVERFEECPIAFRCIACSDDGKARRRVFRQGLLLPAISASMSLPGLLMPRGSDGRPTTGSFDGGLVEKTPLYSPISEHGRCGDGRKLLLLATYYSHKALRVGTARGFVDRFLATIYDLEHQLWEYHHREARSRAGVTLLILTPRIDDPRTFDFARAERNYLQAREHFKEELQNARVPLALGCA